ncbi:MAG: adenylosuccinate synthase [Chlorobiota bacterium]
MPVTVVVGAQWGDEGKGKIVDFLAQEADIVARYQGGANAGHTVTYQGQRLIFHLLPSGILHPHVQCVIGNGVVVDPIALREELATVEQLGIPTVGRLFISNRAHLIMPYHKLLDQTQEQQSPQPIGTTGRGIGPAYIDKFRRRGIRIVDLLHREMLEAKLRTNLEEYNALLRTLYNAEELEIDAIVREYLEFDTFIDPYVTDTAALLAEALRQGKHIIAEGAQGALLDVDHGTYPYVTSSNPTSGGACTGLGIPPTAVTRIIGVAKAYTTRVGHGPFPTELTGPLGDRLRELGAEFGATTGRPRRCGWLDLVALRYSTMVNGITELALTKLDVLSHFSEIPVCVGYRLGTKRLRFFPPDCATLEKVEPEYALLPGWRQPLNGIASRKNLPAAAERYVSFIEEFLGIPIRMLSLGPEREETVVCP